MEKDINQTTRSQILATAAQLCRGSATAPVRFTLGELAEHLEIHYTAIYHYFDSKDHIFKELIEAICARRRVNLTLCQEKTGSALTQLLEFIRLELREPPTDLLVRPTLLLQDPYREQANRAFQATTLQIEKHIQSGIHEGSIRPCSAQPVARLITRILNRYANQRDALLMGSGLTPRKIADQVIYIVRNGFASDSAINKKAKHIRPISFPILSSVQSQLTEIQCALAQAFNTLGYESTSIPRVAASIGLSKTSIYKYAPSKDDLLYLCARQSLDVTSQIRQLSKVVADSPLQALLYNIYFARQLQKASPGPILQPAQFHFLSPVHQQVVWDIFHQQRESLRELIELGMEQGEIRQLETAAAVPALAIYSSQRMIPSPEGFSDEVAQFFLMGLAAR